MKDDNSLLKEEKATAFFFDRVSSELFWVTFENVEQKVLSWIMEKLELSVGDVVLEPGCGAGRFSKIIAPKVSPTGKVVSFDISKKMIKRMAEWRMPAEVIYLSATASSLPFLPAAFNKIVCINVFPHFDDKKRAVKEFARVLRQKGLLFISHTNGREEINKFHATLSPPVNTHTLPNGKDMFELLESAGFRVVLLIDEKDRYFLKAEKR